MTTAASTPEAPHHSLRKITSYAVNNIRFDVTSDYSLIAIIGQGACGVVCSATDKVTEDKVAIKKITKAFEHVTDAKRTLRELKIMRGIHHENILALLDLLPPKHLDRFEDVYMVTELMETDLHQIITSDQELTNEHVQYFVYQILRGLKYLHSAHILHRDLKPKNLLVNANCDLKICDFGLARIADPKENFNGFMTEYVATRWYRAPEIMLSWKQYTQAVDMWSVGCVMAELLGRKPLFPGKNYLDQLTQITDVLGSPSEEYINKIASEKAQRYMHNQPHKDPMGLTNLFPNATPDALDVLGRMLDFDPATRITVVEALEHPYFAQFHDPNDEPTATAVFDFSFEDQELTADTIRSLILQEIQFFEPTDPPADAQQPPPDVRE